MLTYFNQFWSSFRKLKDTFSRVKKQKITVVLESIVNKQFKEIKQIKKNKTSS